MRTLKKQFAIIVIIIAFFTIAGLCLVLSSNMGQASAISIESINTEEESHTKYSDESVELNERFFIPPSVSRAFGGDTISARAFFPINYGTMAVNAICNRTGQLGVLTAQHVVRRHTVYIYRSDEFLGTRLGISSQSQQQFGPWIDAAFVPFEKEIYGA